MTNLICSDCLGPGRAVEIEKGHRQINLLKLIHQLFIPNGCILLYVNYGSIMLIKNENHHYLWLILLVIQKTKNNLHVNSEN